MRREHFAGIVIGVVALVLSSIFLVSMDNWPMKDNAQHYGFTVVNAYPHDAEAFTEGLVFVKGFLYESTGLYGNSTLRRVELATGRILQLHALDARFFGEGLTISGSQIVQLTWQSHTGFVYDKDTFELLREFKQCGCLYIMYGFESGSINVNQTLLAKPSASRCELPFTRADLYADV